MNIVLECNSEKEDIKILNKIIWSNYQKRYLIYTLFLFIGAIVLLISGFQQDYTFLSAIDINGDFNRKNIYQYNFDLSIAFGISLLFIVLAFISVFLKQRKKFNLQVQSLIKIIDNKSTRVITDEFYEYKTSIFERKYKWEAFVIYNVLGDYLVFNVIKKDNSYSDFINLKLLGEVDKKLIFDHLKNIKLDEEILK